MPEEPVNEQTVLRSEKDQIAERRRLQGLTEPPGEDGPVDTVGLALSGGGIRSATFNLGVLQGLADLGLLKYIDYLSTVSGGGYIGGWLAAWVHRSKLETVEKGLDTNRASGSSAKKGEPDEIRHLRRYSNYLAPRTGVLSPDTWVLYASYLRNFLLCQLCLLPAVMAVLLLSRLLVVAYHPDTISRFREGTGGLPPLPDFVPSAEWVTGGFVALLWFVAAFVAFVGSGRVRLAGEEAKAGQAPAEPRRLTPAALFGLVVAPLGAAAVLFCWFAASRQYLESLRDDQKPDPLPWISAATMESFLEHVPFGDAMRTPERVALFCEFLAFLIVPAALVVAAYLAAWLRHRRTDDLLPHLASVSLASAAGGIALFFVHRLLVYLCAPVPSELTDYVHVRAAVRVTTFGPPLVLASIVAAIFLGVGLLRGRIGEELREWWSSLCARLMLVAAGWAAVNLIALYATAVLLWAGPWVQTALASGWLLLVARGVFAGSAPRTDAQTPRNAPAEWMARLAPPLFVAGVLVGISLLLRAAVDGKPNWSPIVNEVGVLRRTDPANAPTKMVDVLVRRSERPGPNADPVELPDVHEHRDSFERSSGLDDTLHETYHYWLGMVHTDLGASAEFRPRVFFRLGPEDIAHLKEAGVSAPALERLKALGRDGEEIRDYRKFLFALKKDVKAHKPELDAILRPSSWAAPGYEQVLARMATDAELIHFDPLALVEKFCAVLCACLAVVALAAWRVGINLNSLHAIYGNRLVRAYLGASRTSTDPKRDPDPITTFDPADDFPLADLAVGPAYDGPYLLVNAAMNLVHGGELAWQERKAAPFVFTPLYCGGGAGGEPNAYRPTVEYARKVGLGTAMTISGAAANPNAGYHSSPAVTALLTIFNARLGVWLGNPRVEHVWRKRGPEFGFWHLVRELFGLTDDLSPYVNLSDGGHFEDLGVYELIRRRCRYVIVCDADCDPAFQFEDLGDMIRKVRIDFGIDIEIDHEALRPAPDGGRSRSHCAVGRIRYDQVDPYALPGTLVYLKPSLTGDEPADVLEYKALSPSFPHETTANQFFTESQFESYRALGVHALRSAFGEAFQETGQRLAREEAGPRQGTRYCRMLFSAVSRRWFSLPPKYEASFVESTHGYMDIQRQLGTDARLRRLSEEMYPELAGTDTAEGTGIHALLKMLQVMENAWLSLDLEVHYAHPLNRGWMGVFYRWTSSDTFLRLWPVVRSEFSRRFVDFCERQMRIGRARVELAEFEDYTRVTNALRREFESWHTSADFRERVRQPRWARLVYTRMDGLPERTPDPCGIALVLAPGAELEAARDHSPQAQARQAPVFEFVIWVRGAYRDSGIGREALIAALKDWCGRMQGDYSLGVRLPRREVSGPGGKMLEQMWLTFFHGYDFRRVEPDKRGATSPEETILLRYFPLPDRAGP
jgi:hypothetical protein